ncbi:MAG: DUF4290 domain-containing protein [Bacteroidales bacterium]|nr:DUF4290 domain-containing protein [Bacteroidales bacterium]
MEYNSTRERLILPEFGRNVQNIIKHITEIADREERTRSAIYLLNVLIQGSPMQKDFADYKRRVWDQIHIISEFKLDVDGPYPAPTPEEVELKPEPVKYTQGHIRYRHYGKNIVNIINEVAKKDDGVEKEVTTQVIANQMKKLYLTWNRDSVNDELIEEQLIELSKGQLKLQPDQKLSQTSDILEQNQPRKWVPQNPKKQNFHKRRKHK